MLSIAELESLLELGQLCKHAKKKIATGCFSTDQEIYNYLSEICNINNLEFSFPPLICNDYVISHVAIEPSKPVFLNQTTIYTIDFGFKNKKTGMITDNSVTITNNKAIEKYTRLYDQALKKIVNDLDEFLKRKGYITSELVTYTIDKHFTPLSEQLHVIPFACSHTIEKNKLHGHTILNTLDSDLEKIKSEYGFYVQKRDHTKLAEGTVFTIEPHVLLLDDILENPYGAEEKSCTSSRSGLTINRIKRIRYDSLKPNIVYCLRTKKYLRLSEVLNGEPIQKDRYTTIAGMWSNRLSFFNENTFLISGREIFSVT